MKKTLAFTCLLLSLVLLSACLPATPTETTATTAATTAGTTAGTTAATTAGETTAASTTTAETTAAAPVELTYMHQSLRSNYDKNGAAKAFFDTLDLYVQNNANVTLKEEGMAHDDYATKIQTLAAASDLPDIYFLKGSWVTNFVKNEQVTSLTPDLEARPEWLNAFVKGAFQASTRDGQIYGVPQEALATSVVFYNAKMFADIGYDSFPATWDEMLDAVEKFKAKDIVAFAMGNKGKWVSESCWLSTLGDRVTGQEWTESVIFNKGAKFTDPDFVKALQVFQDLATLGAFNPDLNSIDNDQHKQLYYDGKAAAFAEGNWAVSSVVLSAPQDILENTKLAVLPTIEGGKGKANAVSGGSGWFISLNATLTDAAKRTAAVDLLEITTGKEWASRLAANDGVPASDPGDYDKSKLSKLQLDFLELNATLEYTPIYDILMEAPVIEVMNSGLQELLAGTKTPEKLAEEIQAEYDKFLEENS